MGGATAQVSVSLPVADDPIDDDDDVVGDEVPYDVDRHADSDAVADSGPAADSEPVADDEQRPSPTAEHHTRTADVPTIDSADVFVIEVSDPAPARDEIDVHDADIVVDAQIQDADIVHEDEVETDAAPVDVTADDAEEDADAVTTNDAAAAAALRTEVDAMFGPRATSDAPTSTIPVAGSGGADAPVTMSGVRPATEATPTTRWEAHHPGTAERPDRAHAVERIHPRTEVTLSSKRLGEFEAGRESADLLTADRLLDPHQVVRPEPEGPWQHFVYAISGKRINLGDGKRARARKELDRRISAPLSGGARFVPVVSRKGGVGKTTITTLLGMALADARDDRIIAVDANPDRGTLADRIARPSGKTVRDLVRARGDVSGYNDISTIVARDETRLDVLASDSDPRISEAFSDRDYHDVASLAAHYYSIVLTDTGTGIVHSVMGATLDLADQLVIVAGLSVDEARLASETLTWLETNGYSEQVRSAVVVLNTARPGTPLVRADELETHFRSRVRAVVRMPYDPLVAAGSAIAFRDLQPATRLAARELAAAVVEGLRAVPTAA
nr:MinD/ParA family protein [Microbacterium ulmi]